MGISDGLEGSMCEVDCSVGAIVWVRRRNGSWWPGRILSSNEVAASNLMSPRSGTPVKLLGREDASVDWYNLEKSKRVKAFRCGEFDECIERAETSQGSAIKKREKYARREDAILHALEIERQQLEKKQQKLGIGVNSVSSKMPSNSKKDLGTPENLGNNFKSVNLKSQALSRRLDSTLVKESMENPLYAGQDKHGRQTSWEGANSESLPRMRGLQDFGLKIAPKKRKLSASVISEGSQKPLAVENHVDDLSSGIRSLGGKSYFGTSKNPLAVKRKSTLGGLADGSPAKRRDRRRPLVQVLQNSVKLLSSQSLQSDGDGVAISIQREKEDKRVSCRSKRSKCVYLPADSNDGLADTESPLDKMHISQSQFGTENCHLHPDSLTEESNSSGLREDEGSDFSERGDLYQDINEEMAVVSGATQVLTILGPRNSNRSKYEVHGQPGSIMGQELDESVFTGYVSQHQRYDQTAGATAADVGVSKWKLKGKRNSRNLAKRALDLMDGENYKGSVHGIYFEGKRNSLNRRVIGQGYHVNEDLNFGFDVDEKDQMQWGYGNRSGRSSHKIFNSEALWDADGLSQTAALRGYWDEAGECFGPIYDGHSPDNMMESLLVEVDLKVQASYQGGEHVPLVSLMSRLNGKAIIGHPVQIEALEDGSSDLLCTNGDLREEPVDSSTPVPPVWRTARRTVMHRVPRPHPSSALEGEEVPADHHDDQIPDLESKPAYKKPFAGHLSHKARLMRKSISNIRLLPTGKKIAKKLLKKVSLSSQKTRRLSSIAVDHKRSGKSSDPKLGSKSSLKRLIKTVDEGLRPTPTIVTCIPVKLVYSRLLEAIGKPPSKKTESHGVLINGDTETKENHSS